MGDFLATRLRTDPPSGLPSYANVRVVEYASPFTGQLVTSQIEVPSGASPRRWLKLANAETTAKSFPYVGDSGGIALAVDGTHLQLEDTAFVSGGSIMDAVGIAVVMTSGSGKSLGVMRNIIGLDTTGGHKVIQIDRAWTADGAGANPADGNTYLLGVPCEARQFAAIKGIFSDNTVSSMLAQVGIADMGRDQNNAYRAPIWESDPVTAIINTKSQAIPVGGGYMGVRYFVPCAGGFMWRIAITSPPTAGNYSLWGCAA